MIRDEIQLSAVNSLIDNYTNKRNKGGGLLHIAPRVGKSKIVIDFLNHILKENEQLTVTISAVYNDILDSWVSELNKWECSVAAKLVNQRSITKEHYSDILIIDECHTLSENQINNIHSLNFKYVIGLSGTITDKTHKELYPILTRKVIYYYPIEKAITDGIISNYNIVVYTLPLDNKDAYIESGAANKKFLTTELSNYGYLTKQFNKFRMMSFKDPKFSNMKYKYAGMRSRFIYSAKSKVNLVNRFINSFSSDEPILIFTTLTDVANILNTDTHHSKSNVKSKYVDLTNNDEITNLELFKQGIINRLAVCNMVSMGITIPNLKIAVFHQLQSSPELAQQKILRACNFVSRDTIAQIFIFVYENTVDMDWLQQALEPFDHKKIRYDSFRNIK